jgi:prefoldin subunit 5
VLQTQLGQKQKDVLEMDGEVERYKIQIQSLNDKIGELECSNIELRTRKDED